MKVESPQTSAKLALANLAQTDPNNLFTASISSVTSLPYTAVIDYVSLTESPEASVNKDTSGCNVLSISQFDDVLPKDLPNDFESTKRTSSGYVQIMNDRAFSNFKQSASSKCDIPRLSFGEGHVIVPWPIPPHLSADALFSIRQGKTSLPKDDINCSLENVSTNAEEASPIYVAHYPVGIPFKDCSGKLSRMHELLLATTKPEPNLRDVITTLTHWKEEKDRRVKSPDGYALFRLKTDNFGDVYWVHEGLRRSRSPSSIILCDNLLERILEDLRGFLSPSAIQWYRQHDLPHRRSYLFTGPPGTGKTSTIRMLASKFDLACCFLTLTDKKFSNQTLAEALSGIPSKALLVLEDVDALFIGRESRSAEGLTFSGVLNVLDGVLSAEHVVVVMTTNHPERLDEALVRAGRVDRRFHFAEPGGKQIEELFRRFYPCSPKADAETFVEAIMKRKPDGACSIANLQQLFIQYRGKEGAECVGGIQTFFDNMVAQKQEDDKVSNGKEADKEEEKKMKVELSLDNKMNEISKKILAVMK